MIKHVYLYKLTDRALAREAADRLLTMADQIPSIHSVEVGIDFIGADASYDLFELVCCATQEDFHAFCIDPYHDEVRAYMKTIVEKSCKVDFLC